MRAGDAEFNLAVAAHGLTSEFRSECFRTVDEVMALIRTWAARTHAMPAALSVPRGLP